MANKGLWAKLKRFGTDTRGADITGTHVAGDKHALDVAIKEALTLAVSPSGLSIAGEITIVTLSSGSWTALPVTPLTNRNAIGVQNQSGTEIKLNFDSGEAGYIGWTIKNNGEIFLDITDSVIIYAKAAAGTPSITVMEIS